MERDFLKSVLAVKKLEAEVRQAVQQVWRERSSPPAATLPHKLLANPTLNQTAVTVDTIAPMPRRYPRKIHRRLLRSTALSASRRRSIS